MKVKDKSEQLPIGFLSKYSKKVRQGKQMYGPGCCANGQGPLKIHKVLADYASEDLGFAPRKFQDRR
jgi:hypothetical protein